MVFRVTLCSLLNFYVGPGRYCLFDRIGIRGIECLFRGRTIAGLCRLVSVV